MLYSGREQVQQYIRMREGVTTLDYHCKNRQKRYCVALSKCVTHYGMLEWAMEIFTITQFIILK